MSDTPYDENQIEVKVRRPCRSYLREKAEDPNFRLTAHCVTCDCHDGWRYGWESLEDLLDEFRPLPKPDPAPRRMMWGGCEQHEPCTLHESEHDEIPEADRYNSCLVHGCQPV